jgi:hypothetical protein
MGIALAFISGVIDFAVGLADHLWRLGPAECFTGWILLALMALCVLIDGAVGFEKITFLTNN